MRPGTPGVRPERVCDRIAGIYVSQLDARLGESGRVQICGATHRLAMD